MVMTHTMGIYTYVESVRKKINENTKLKSYYMNKYKTDELGVEIKSNITFNDLFKCLDGYNCVYDFIGVGDSIVRERLFSALAIVMECDYDYIYNQWLSNDR